MEKNEEKLRRIEEDNWRGVMKNERRRGAVRVEKERKRKVPRSAVFR